jgi:hypothetical protein
MHEETVFILKEKFKALEQAVDIDDQAFCSAAIQYSCHVGNSLYLSNLVKQLGLEREIDRKIFFRMFMYSTLKTGFKNQNLKQEGVGTPLFWSKEIEAIYHLYSRFITLLQKEQRRLLLAKEADISILDIVLPEERDEADENMTNEMELFEFRILHNEILTKASIQEKRTISFDSDSGTLLIGQQSIKFRKFTEQYHSLRVIFSNPNETGKEWMFSELSELIDGAKYTDKAFHNYFSAIKRRVSADAGIKDLFITTNQSVKIDRDYL